jgi:hypothetical protein
MNELATIKTDVARIESALANAELLAVEAQKAAEKLLEEIEFCGITASTVGEYEGAAKEIKGAADVITATRKPFTTIFDNIRKLFTTRENAIAAACAPIFVRIEEFKSAERRREYEAQKSQERQEATAFYKDIINNGLRPAAYPYRYHDYSEARGIMQSVNYIEYEAAYLAREADKARARAAETAAQATPIAPAADPAVSAKQLEIEKQISEKKIANLSAPTVKKQYKIRLLNVSGVIDISTLFVACAGHSIDIDKAQKLTIERMTKAVEKYINASGDVPDVSGNIELIEQF